MIHSFSQSFIYSDVGCSGAGECLGPHDWVIPLLSDLINGAEYEERIRTYIHSTCKQGSRAKTKVKQKEVSRTEQTTVQKRVYMKQKKITRTVKELKQEATIQLLYLLILI